MTRSGNRRRRVPYYPASSGAFQPKEQQSQHGDHQEGMDSQTSGSDLGDRQSIGSDHHPDLDAADRQSNSSDRKHDAADRQMNGGEHRQNGAAQNGGDHRHNGRGRRFDGSDRIRKDSNNEQRAQAPEARHQRSQSRDRPHYHHHYQKNQRWEGKDTHDQNKDPASTIARDEVVKAQDYTPAMASKARELKEEGNRRFQRKDYLGAMDQYELALKLTPSSHPDRAVFHSNRAACLMQMKPAQHDAAIRECNLALEVQPGFGRALLRRARAYEACGKLELALQDVQLLLQGDVSHPDALDMAKRIRLSMEYQGDEAQQDQGRPPTPAAFSRSKSYAGASAVPSSGAATPLSASRSFCTHNASNSASVSSNFSSPQQIQNAGPSVLTSSQSFRQMQSPPRAPSQPIPTSWPIQRQPSTTSNELPSRPNELSAPRTPPVDPSKVDSLEKIIHQDNGQSSQLDTSPAAPLMRPLKLIYDHDIRLAEMPISCKFGDLRKLVKSKFPSSKAILMKYKDVEGDLVTITSTEELRLAEVAAAVEAARRNLRASSMSAEGTLPQERRTNSAIGLPVMPSVLDQLRLHIVEVPAEQEPYDMEDALNAQGLAATANGTGKAATSEHKVIKERDFDKWLLEFAHLFRMHLGIDPSGHVDFHDLGLELCAEALEETITTEEAHKLFEQAGCKFQEMVALGFLNWGNVYMCAARKEVPHDSEDDHQIDFYEKLQAVFDWAHAQFALAEEKFQLSLKVKPDFVDGMLGLGQKDFESAKLSWSLAVASQKDLKAWDSSKALEIFHRAAEHTKKAAELLGKQGESHGKEVEVHGLVDAHHESANAEQDAALRTQIYLFWGNILYEHSQVEYRLGLHSWKELLDGALDKFELAGIPSSDITMALHKHLSNSSAFIDVKEETAEQDEGDRIAETGEVKDGLQNDDDENNMQVEAPGVTDLAKSMKVESPSEEHAPEDGGTDLAKSMLAESPCEEHLPVDGATHPAKSLQANPHSEEHVPIDGVTNFEASMHLESLSEEHVLKASVANQAESVPVESSFPEQHAPKDNVRDDLKSLKVESVSEEKHVPKENDADHSKSTHVESSEDPVPSEGDAEVSQVAP